MPKTSATDQDSTVAVLCSSKDAILQNGNIATPKALVWTDLSEQPGKKISAKALYTFVKGSGHNVWTALGFSTPETAPETDEDWSSLP